MEDLRPTARARPRYGYRRLQVLLEPKMALILLIDQRLTCNKRLDFWPIFPIIRASAAQSATWQYYAPIYLGRAGKLPFLGRRLPKLSFKPATGPLTGALRLFRRTRNDEAKEQGHETNGQGSRVKGLGHQIVPRSSGFHTSADRPWL